MAGPPVSGTQSPHEWIRRYLDLLGIDHPALDLDALTRLTRAHLLAVRFENVTSILRRWKARDQPVPPLDPEELLSGWEHQRGGGLCFEVAEMLSRLLVALGYRAHVVLGAITFLGSHQAVLVELDGRRYLVDAVNGAPFFEPIPLDDGPFEVRRAGLAYRFRLDDTADECVQDRQINGVWEPFCRYELRPVDPYQREVAYQRHHTLGEGWVVGSLTLIRCAADELYLLRNQEFTRFSPAGKHTERVIELAATARLAAEVFQMPGLPVEKGLRALAEFRRASVT